MHVSSCPGWRRRSYQWLAREVIQAASRAPMRSEIDGRRAQSPGTPTPRLPALDGLRGYAILAVVVLHVLGASGVLASIEGTRSGVVVWALLGNPIDVFMIISGFVLFLPAVRRGTFGSVREYALDRAARL